MSRRRRLRGGRRCHQRFRRGRRRRDSVVVAAGLSIPPFRGVVASHGVVTVVVVVRGVVVAPRSPLALCRQDFSSCAAACARVAFGVDVVASVPSSYGCRRKSAALNQYYSPARIRLVRSSSAWFAAVGPGRYSICCLCHPHSSQAMYFVAADRADQILVARIIIFPIFSNSLG